MATNFLSLRSSATASLTAVNLTLSTLTGSTISGSTITALSNANIKSLAYSTLQGSSITTSTITASTITISSLLQVSSSGLLGIGTNPTQALHVQGSTIVSGAIGIGTTNPTAPLHLFGSGQRILLTGGAEQTYMMFTNATNNVGYIGTGASGNDIIINAYSGYNTILQAGGAEYMRIISTGNVGIRTNNPSTPLHISGSPTSYGIVYVNSLSATLSGTAGSQDILQRWYESTGNANYVDLSWVRVFAGSDWNTSAQRFQSKTDSTWQGFMQFYNYGIQFGTGGSSVSANSVPVVMSILSGGNVGIGITNPAQTLDVNGTIARNGLKLPRFDYGTLGPATSVSIPILFSDTQYTMVEIRFRYEVSAVTDINMSATSTTPATMNLGEVGLTTVKYNAQSAPVYNNNAGTTSFIFASTVEQVGIANNLMFRIVRSIGSGGAGQRNHYCYDNVYCWSGVGTARGYGQGHIDNTGVGGPAIAYLNFICVSGNINGNWSTTHYN